MTDARPCAAKSHAELVLEWDKLAGERHHQIVSGEDLSFEHVVAPTTFLLLEEVDTAVILDIGCGTGDFTKRLARVAARVIGIEPSHASLAIARSILHDAPNVSLVEAPLEEAGDGLREESITAAVSVMTVMTTPDLRAFANTLGGLLPNGTVFVATLCHPWFWPRYCAYEETEWFSYSRETFIEAPFVISKRTTDIMTTHVHRPLEQYVSIFASAGFKLDALMEPMPSAEVEALYPRPWQFPRFLGIRWVKSV
jgi:SAM-dependent methyltransferase